jgi:hypothetical protein
VFFVRFGCGQNRKVLMKKRLLVFFSLWFKIDWKKKRRKTNGEVASGQLLIRLHNSFNDDTKEQPIPITMLVRKKRISWPFFQRKKRMCKTLPTHTHTHTNLSII